MFAYSALRIGASYAIFTLSIITSSSDLPFFMGGRLTALSGQCDHRRKIMWEPMPFYLVTQTSLVEAADQQAAAQKAIDRIRSGAQVDVSVRYDEATVSHVIVAARIDSKSTTPIAVKHIVEPTKSVATKAVSVDPRDKRLILRRMMADARALMTWRG